MELIGAITMGEASEHEASTPMLILIHEDHQELSGDVDWVVRPEVQQAPVFRYGCKPESLDDDCCSNTQTYGFLSALEDLPTQDKHVSIITTCFGGLVLTKALMLAFTSDALSQSNTAVQRHVQALKRVVSVTCVKLSDEETGLFQKATIAQFLESVFDDGGRNLDISNLLQPGAPVNQENNLARMILQGVEPRPNEVRMNFFSVQTTENDMASATVDVPTSLFPNLPPFDIETILAFHETSFFAEGGNNSLGEARLIYNAINAISRETESTPKQSASSPDVTKVTYLTATIIEGSESPTSPGASSDYVLSESWISEGNHFTSNSLPLEFSGLDLQDQLLSDDQCLSRATSRGRRAASSNFDSDRGSLGSARTVTPHVTGPAQPTHTNPSRVNEVTSYTINNYYGSSQSNTFAAGMAGVAIGACLQSAAASLPRVQKHPGMFEPETSLKVSTPKKSTTAHSVLTPKLDSFARIPDPDVNETKRLNAIWSKSRVISDILENTAEPDGNRDYKEKNKSRSPVNQLATIRNWSDDRSTSESTAKPHSCTNKHCPKEEATDTTDGMLEIYLNDTSSVQDRLLSPPNNTTECRKERPDNVLRELDTKIKKI